MTINKKDITIIIQGPLNKTSLDKLEHYVEFGKIIVSHWAEDSLDLQQQLIEAQVKYSNISSISSSDPPEPYDHPGLIGSVQKKDYRYHQFQSTHEALKICKTKYAIKTRSDEYWLGLEPLLEKFSQDDSKMVTSNVFCKPYYPQPYHISDHLMLAKTDLFLEGLDMIAINKRENLNVVATECTFGIGFLHAKHGSELPTNKESFEKDFAYVNINEFKGYLVRWNTPPRGPKLIWQKPEGQEYMGENGVV